MAPPSSRTPGSPCQIEVIAAGLPRCGTSSLTTALESQWLGLNPTMHMGKLKRDPKLQRLTIAAFHEQDKAKRQKLVLKWMEGYAATADTPSINFLTDLFDLYPSAKIILNTRNSAKSWATSVRDTIALNGTSLAWFSSLLVTPWHLHYAISRLITDDFGRRFGIQMEHEWPPELYDRYVAWVRREVKDRGSEVLEWKPEEGWEPLCRFLGRACPPENVPFPHVNDAKGRRRAILMRQVEGMAIWGALIVVMICIVGWLVR